MRLSACLIVRNEEACIEACLRSLDGFDQVVVLDTGSTDRTGEIAERFANVLYIRSRYKWRDDFAHARNAALEYCTCDWVLSIDADEVLESPVELVRLTTEIADVQGHRAVGCRLVADKSGELHLFPRLFKNFSNIVWHGTCHETLTRTTDTQSDVTIRYGRSPSHDVDPDRNLRILLKYVKANPGCRREKFYLAREYWYKGRNVEAIGWLKDYLSGPSWLPERAEAWLLLARIYWETGQGDKAREACAAAIVLNPDFREALRFMSLMVRPEKAEKWLRFAEIADNSDVLFVRG